MKKRTKIILLIFLLTSLGMVYMVLSPFTKLEPNDVYIRIDNQTGWDLDRLTIGRRMQKVNSYKSKSFTNVFNDVRNNAV